MVLIITIPHGGAISDIHDKMEIKAQRFIEKKCKSSQSEKVWHLNNETILA